MIPFVNLKAQRDAYRAELLEAESRVLDSGRYILGHEVDLLEQELAVYSGCKHVITCGNGTDALEMALMALGLREGDEVIVPDFTFISPAECVCRLGAKPRFVDISAETFLLDPECVEACITPKTVGILAVHLFGQSAKNEALQKLAEKHHLWILGDAAQAFGALRNGKHVVASGNVSVTSFYPTKPLGAYGDGGAVFTNDDKIAERVYKLRNHGARSPYFHEIIGKNSRLDAFQAAVLRVKLKHLDEELAVRRQNAERYDAFFKKFEDVQTPRIEAENISSYAEYTLRSVNRSDWLAVFERAAIPTEIYYPRTLTAQPCFSFLPPIPKNPRAARACHEVFSLPVCAFSAVGEILKRIEAAL